MLRDGHVNRGDLLLLLGFAMGSKVFLVTSRVMIAMAYNAAWVAILAGAAVASLVALATAALLWRFKGMGLVQVGNALLGPYLGKLVGLALTGYFIAVTPIRLREFSETIAGVVLPRTPISVIVGTYTALMVYACLSGIEGISRTARVLVPFVALPAVALAAGLFPWVHPVRLLPVMDVPLGDLARSSAFAVTLFSEFIAIGVLAPFARAKGDLVAGVGGVWAAGVLTAATTVLAVMAFSVTGALQLQFPTYAMASLVRVGRFAERMESMYVFIWFFSAAISLAVFFYCACVAAAQTLNLREYRPLVWPMAVLVFSLAFVPDNVVQVFDADVHQYGLYASVGALALPLLLWAVALLRRYPKAGQTLAGFLLVACIGSLLTGCWDSRELKEQGFASLMAVDKGKSLPYLVTLQIPRPMPTGESPPPGTAAFQVYAQEGATISEAVARMGAYMSRRPNLSHLKLIVIGGEASKGGAVRDLANMGLRSTELRSTVVVAYSPGKAGAIAEIVPSEERGPSEYYEHLLQESVVGGASYPSTLHEVETSAIVGVATNPVVPYVVPKAADLAASKQPTAISMNGLAVFKNDVYAGHLSPKATEGWLIITGRMRSAVVSVRAAGGQAVARVREVATRVTPTESGNAKSRHYSFAIRVDADADLLEASGKAGQRVDTAMIAAVGDGVAAALNERCRAAITEAQRLDADIFGLGRDIRASHPLKEWLGLRWDRHFKASKFRIKVTAHVRRSGGLFSNVEGHGGTSGLTPGVEQ